MYISDLKTGYYYYIQAKYLRGFERYYGKIEDITKVLSIKVVEKPQQEYWTTLKVSCAEYKNPKSKDGVWYIIGKYISKIREEKYNYKYYLKITYVNDKYGKNRNRILETNKSLLEYHNVFKQIDSTIMQKKPLYIPVESNTSKAGFEIVKIKDIHKVACDDNGNQLYQCDDKWLLDPDYNPQLGVLHRRLVSTQLVYWDYVKSINRANTFFEDEYDRLTEESITTKNEIVELKLANKELQDRINKLTNDNELLKQANLTKNKNYVELQKNYYVVSDKLKQLQDNEIHDDYDKTEGKQKCNLENCSNNEGTINPDDTNVYGSKISDVRKIKELESTINDLKLMLAERDLEIYNLKKDR